MEHDPHERGDRKHGGQHAEDPAQRRPHRCLDPAEDREERDRAADAGEEEREAQEARDGEPDGDLPRDRVVLQHLLDDAGRVARRLDGEDECAVQRMRVGRDDAPGHRVRAAGERTVVQLDRDGLRVRTGGPAESTRFASES